MHNMWNPLTIINAVEGESLFAFSERGLVTVSGKGETFFTPSPTGNIRHQLPRDAMWNDSMLERIRSFNKKH